MNVAIIGDSIVHGGIDEEFGGWVNRLKIQSVRENRGDHVFNLGIGGNSSRDILERADIEIKARKGHVQNVIFSTGTNDMNLNMPVAEYQANLERLGAIASGYGLNVFFMGLFLRVDRETTKETSAYNNVIQQVCEKCGYTYIPTLDLIEVDDLYGCHPNTKGHVKLCARVAEFFKE